MVALQDTAAVPDPVMLVGIIAPQVSPDGIVSVRATLPVKPFSAIIVIVEVGVCPTFTGGGEEAVTVKSTKLNVAVVVCTRELLVPITVRAYVPATVAEHDTVAVPEPV